MVEQILLSNRPILDCDAMTKEKRIKRYKAMTSNERQELIAKKMKARGIEMGSGVPNKIYDNKEIYDLILIAKCFSELRKKANS